MLVLTSVPDLARVPGPVVLAVGVFDGIHLGHQAVVSTALDLAGMIDGTMALATFEPHPARVLRPETAPYVLTSLPHKKLLAARLGVGHMLIVPFTRALANEEPSSFVESLVRAARPLGGIVCGADFAFGRGRSGNPALLAALGETHGFRVLPVAPVMLDGEGISSTRLRQAVRTGDFALCRRLLGREHSVLGTVVEGRRLGRSLGFPTANLSVHSELLPPDGVYAVQVRVEDRRFGGVANQGIRPTVEAPGAVRRILEVHLFDFAGDLYGRDIEVRFVRFLREERAFANLDELSAAIRADAEAARQALAAG